MALVVAALLPRGEPLHSDGDELGECISGAFVIPVSDTVRTIVVRYSTAEPRSV